MSVSENRNPKIEKRAPPPPAVCSARGRMQVNASEQKEVSDYTDGSKVTFTFDAKGMGEKSNAAFRRAIRLRDK